MVKIKTPKCIRNKRYVKRNVKNEHAENDVNENKQLSINVQQNENVLETKQNTAENSNNTNNQSKNRKWTSDEDNLLRSAVNQYGEKQWKFISAFVESRDHGKIIIYQFINYGEVFSLLY